MTFFKKKLKDRPQITQMSLIKKIFTTKHTKSTKKKKKTAVLGKTGNLSDQLSFIFSKKLGDYLTFSLIPPFFMV